MAVLEKYQNIMEAFNELYESLSSLNEKQEEALKTYFDIRGIPYNLGYAYIPEESVYVFSMSKDAFKRWEYYLGMEYARDEIVFFLQIDNDVIVGYYECSRVSSLYDVIEENEEPEDEEDE